MDSLFLIFILFFLYSLWLLRGIAKIEKDNYYGRVSRISLPIFWLLLISNHWWKNEIVYAISALVLILVWVSRRLSTKYELKGLKILLDEHEESKPMVFKAIDRSDEEYIENCDSSEFRSEFSGQLPLVWAVNNGNESIATLLVDRDADCEIIYEASPLIFYIVKHRMEDLAIKLLKEDRIQSLVSEYSGEHLIFSAVDKGLKHLVAKLLNSGVDVNIRDSNGWVPLFHALNNNDYEMAKYLVELGADVTSRESMGNEMYAGSALMYCLDNYEMFKYLLDRGADPFATTEDGNLLDMAVTLKSSAIEKLLRGFGVVTSYEDQ